MALEPNRYDVSIRRGDCWSLVVTWRPGDMAIDMTGYTAEFVVSWPAQTPVGLAPIGAGSIESTPAIDVSTSKVTVALEANDTDGIPMVSRATYQLRVTDADGCKTTIAVGNAVIYQDYIDG